MNVLLFPVLGNGEKLEEHRSQHHDSENRSALRIINKRNFTLYNGRIAAMNVLLFPVLGNGEKIR